MAQKKTDRKNVAILNVGGRGVFLESTSEGMTSSSAIFSAGFIGIVS